jgi:hypothetical protein
MRLRTEDFPPDYKLDFMQQVDPERIPRSEPYVTSPPALWVRDADGSVFTLGFDHGGWSTGEFEYEIVWNGHKTGEFACRIEYRGGIVRIYGRAGWRTWSTAGKRFI